MEVQSVPKIGISTFLHSNQLAKAGVRVIGDDIVMLDTLDAVQVLCSPNRLDVAGIGLCLTGHSQINVNLREYEFRSGKVLVVLPNQIIENREVSEDFHAVFLAVSKKVMESLPKMADILSLFFVMKDTPCVAITAEEQQMFLEYYSLIWKKMKDNANSYQRETVLGILQACFYELCNIFRRHIPATAAQLGLKSRKEYLFERFYEELTQAYQSERSVKYYADQLCLTPKHLSGVIKEVSGKTAGDWIDEFVVQEAKALLNSSSMNIQEIANCLNFANQSFFGKYFKHNTGMSPKEYRKARL